MRLYSCERLRQGLCSGFRGNAETALDDTRPSSAQHSLGRGDRAWTEFSQWSLQITQFDAKRCIPEKLLVGSEETTATGPERYEATDFNVGRFVGMGPWVEPAVRLHF